MKKKKKRNRKAKTVPRGHSPAASGSGKLARRNSAPLQASPSKCIEQYARQQKVIEKFHPHFLGFRAYFKLSDAMGGELLDTAGVGAGNFIMEPLGESDPLLSLAHNLALLAHGRAAWLTQQSVALTDARSLAVHLQGCERATTTFVQLMNAISKNRHAKNPSATISIGQANVAHQQVVHNVRGLEENQTENDEQTKMGPVIEAEVISAVTERIEIPEGINPTDATLDQEHGTSHSGGESKGFNERAQTRRTLHHHRRIPKTGEDHD